MRKRAIEVDNQEIQQSHNNKEEKVDVSLFGARGYWSVGKVYAMQTWEPDYESPGQVKPGTVTHHNPSRERGGFLEGYGSASLHGGK